MLDVHPPHSAPHTWRDFFIHIATITVGLLIAIGLEQTVEAIHHANQRRELIAEMRDESQLNVDTAHRDIDGLLASAEWFIAAAHAIEQTHPQHGTVSLVLPPHAPLSGGGPVNRAVWTLALTNGKAALLADNQAKIYERLDLMTDRVDTAIALRNSIGFDESRLEMRLHIRIQPGARITIVEDEIPSLLRILADKAASFQHEARWDAVVAGYNTAVINNISDQKEAQAYSDAERVAFEKRIGETN